MPKTNLFAVAVGIIGLAASVSAQGITPGEIFEQVTTTYERLQTYKSEGTIVSDVDTGAVRMKIETSFSILLKKPNLYLISWAQKNPLAGTQDGAVWSDGAQPYLYMGIMKAYSKMGSDELALASAAGISSGATLTVPSLFFSMLKQSSPFSRLRDAKIEKTEMVGEEECYVISGASTVSKEETFWISKTKHLIVKYARSVEPNGVGVPVPEGSDADLDDALRGMGQEVTAENRKSVREMVNRSQDLLKNAKIKVSSAETHASVSSPELAETDFRFVPPEGTVMKESLFDSVFSGGKEKF